MFKTTEDIYNEIQEVKRLLESLISNNQINDESGRNSRETINDNILLSHLYSEINSLRKLNNVNSLEVNSYLEKLADIHSHDMFVNNFMAHNSSNGMTYEQRSLITAPNLNPKGEVLMKGPGGPNAVKTVVSTWSQNPSLLNVMMDPEILYMGGGYRLKTEEIKGNYWCAVFGN